MSLRRDQSKLQPSLLVYDKVRQRATHQARQVVDQMDALRRALEWEVEG